MESVQRVRLCHCVAVLKHVKGASRYAEIHRVALGHGMPC